MPTAWTTISNLLVAVGAKPFATTIQALRDNPVAIAEGAPNAPRILLPALERLRPGTSIRFRDDSVSTLTSSIFTTIATFQPGFMQAGTVTIAFEHSVISSTSEVRIYRFRGGTATLLTTISTGSTGYVAQTYNVDVQPGDVIFLQHRNTSGSTSNVRNKRLQVDAATYYWPANTFGYVEGNPTITSP